MGIRIHMYALIGGQNSWQSMHNMHGSRPDKGVVLLGIKARLYPYRVIVLHHLLHIIRKSMLI